MVAAVEAEKAADRDGFRLQAKLDKKRTATAEGTAYRDGDYYARGGEWLLSGRFRLDDRGVTLASYVIEEAPPTQSLPRPKPRQRKGGWSDPSSSALPRSSAPGITTVALRRFPPARVRRAILRELRAGDELGTQFLPPDVERYVAGADDVRRGRPRKWLEADQRRFAKRAIEMGVDGLGPVRKRLAHEFDISEKTATSKLHTLRQRGYLAPARHGHAGVSSRMAAAFRNRSGGRKMSRKTRGKRAAGEGAVYQRPDGRWVAQVTLEPDRLTGARRRRTVYGRTQQEALTKLRDVRRDIDAGLTGDGDRITVQEHLDRWLESLPGQVAESTAQLYRDLSRLHLVPQLGRKRLRKLSVADVDRRWSEMRAAGYSANTIRLTRSTLRRALHYAERDGLVLRNVAGLSAPPRIAQLEGKALSVDEAKVFLEATRGDRLEAAFVVMLTLGLRRGETLGLSWADLEPVDWSDRQPATAPTLTVRRAVSRSREKPGVRTRIVVGEVKTARSRRTIHLPAPVVDALRAHKVRQAQERRWAAGSRWTDHGLVFTTPLGTPCDPDNFARHFAAMARRAGLGHWHPHDARHSAASIMLAQGVPLHVVSEVLGHSSIRLTKDVYGHLEASARQAATEASAAALFGAELAAGGS